MILYLMCKLQISNVGLLNLYIFLPLLTCKENIFD